MESDAEKLRKILSLNIKKRRMLLNFSQERLAEAAELSAQTINDIEGRRMWVSDKTITRLAAALEVEAYELLKPEERLPDNAANIIETYTADISSHFGVMLNSLRNDYLAKMLKSPSLGTR